LYRGGVIGFNGEIHLIPNKTSIGQKFNTKTGVASTYSIITTGSSADISAGNFSYSGGVLAPNGDIHFIPQSAQVGQKVSINGVVSTYSIPYSSIHNTNNRFNGVIDLDGNIHIFTRDWVANAVKTIEKISTTSGITSTYNILSPITGTSNHVFIDLNDNIHPVFTSSTGVKISKSGVVSTYSLNQFNTSSNTSIGLVGAHDTHIIANYFSNSSGNWSGLHVFNNGSSNPPEVFIPSSFSRNNSVYIGNL
jgi:hypothetical protein